jgi:hypothetical protein
VGVEVWLRAVFWIGGLVAGAALLIYLESRRPFFFSPLVVDVVDWLRRVTWIAWLIAGVALVIYLGAQCYYLTRPD